MSAAPHADPTNTPLTNAPRRAAPAGVFRIACENVLQLLRDNKDTLMSVLDAFIHDPLVEWEDEKRKIVRPPPLFLRSPARRR